MPVAELDRCVNDLGMKGVEISTNVNGTDLTRAGLEKFFARVEELGVVIFMHPIGTSFKERMTDHYFRNTIGHPLESALAVGHLVFDGYLETYSGPEDLHRPWRRLCAELMSAALITPITCVMTAG